MESWAVPVFWHLHFCLAYESVHCHKALVSHPLIHLLFFFNQVFYLFVLNRPVGTTAFVQMSTAIVRFCFLLNLYGLCPNSTTFSLQHSFFLSQLPVYRLQKYLSWEHFLNSLYCWKAPTVSHLYEQDVPSSQSFPPACLSLFFPI